MIRATCAGRSLPAFFYYSEMLRCQDETPTPELRTFCTAKRIIIICVVRYNKQKFIVRKRGVAVDNILNTITAYREERKWSLYDLATHAELKTSTISTWYNNNAIPTIPSLVKICDAFQITLSEFLQRQREVSLSRWHLRPSRCRSLRSGRYFALTSRKLF